MRDKKKPCFHRGAGFFYGGMLMKRIAMIMLVIFSLLPITQAFATIFLTFKYDSEKKNYVVSYYKQISLRPGKFKIQFDNATTNVHIQKTYTDPHDISGIYYLTCDGDYKFTFWDGTGTLLGESSNIHTTGTTNACDSYAGDLDTYNYQKPSSGNDLVVEKESGPAGTELVHIFWPSASNPLEYSVYKDGVVYDAWSPDTGSSDYYIHDLPAGTYSFCTQSGNNLDCSDYILTDDMIDKGYYEPGDQSDPWAGNYSPGVPNNGTPGGALNAPPIVFPPDPPDYGPFDPACMTCKELWELLQCPDFDTYMGELTKAIQAALPPPPPPPDWDAIAEKIGTSTINHLEDYIGPVPDPPTQAEIDGGLDKTLPPINIITPADNLVPTVPAGYEQPKPFDISDGPQIDIKDDSKPFSITDPLSNMSYSAPGAIVKPGDPANNTGGIQKPGTITGTIPKPITTPPAPGNPVPKPTTNPGSGAVPGTPTLPPPGSTPPTPGGTGGPGPVPTWKGG
jgi:hypothetical protein